MTGVYALLTSAPAAARRLSISLGRYTTVFRAEICAILASAHEIQLHVRPEKHVSICSDSQAALKALQAATTSPLVQQCQKALNDISTWHSVGLYSGPVHAGVRGNENANKLARDSSVQKFVGREPALGVSRQNIRRKISRWLVNQHWARWWGLGNTQQQARELILGPCPCARTRFLSLNRTQSTVVTGLLTGHNTLGRYLHLMVLSNSPLCRRCGAEDETSAHILCACKALASLRHVYLGSFLDPADFKRLQVWGPSGTLVKAKGSNPNANQSITQSIGGGKWWASCPWPLYPWGMSS
jgi:ribonuclease HI